MEVGPLLAVEAPTITSIDVINTVIAGLALLGVVVNSIIQYRQWRASQLKVEVEGSGAIYSQVPGRADEGLSVEARNVGGQTVIVKGWGFELPNKHQIIGHANPNPLGPTVPHELVANDGSSWIMPLESLRQDLARNGWSGNVQLRAFVNLAHGDRVHAKKTVAIDIN